jgi:nickel/cobalt exporter
MANKRGLSRIFVLLWTIGTVFLIPRVGWSHPMGNFSINHFSALEIHPTVLRLSYVIDMAEIPTFQEMQAHDLIAQPEDPRVVVYRERKAQELQPGLILQLDGQPLPLAVYSSALTFPPGAGDLPTLRLVVVYEAPLARATGRLVYEDRNYPQRVGWKEIIATAAAGVTLAESSVPTVSKSQQLISYAVDLLQAPPQDVRATLAFAVSAEARAQTPTSSAAVTADTSGATAAFTPRDALTQLITTRQLSTGVLLFSVLVAIGLGAFHALEPGHGKTLVAAYLVGSRGTAWHALVLGLIVTASHTVGVYALGGIALFASHYVLPEQLYPWLGVVSGVLITAMGVVLLTRAWQGDAHPSAGHSHHHPYSPSDHSHRDGTHHHHDPLSHGHSHEHAHYQEHAHAHHPHGDQETRQVSYGALLTLGITGGMIPCPAALVVLLSAVALQRIAFGLLLIVAFSVGLAVVLVGTGLLFVSARGVVQRWSGNGPWLTYLPFLSPLVITPLGVVIVVRSLLSTGLLHHLPF